MAAFQGKTHLSSGGVEKHLRMFERVWIYTNLGNTKSMKCTPGFIWGKTGKEAYKRLENGEGANFQERKRTRESWGECGMPMESYSLQHYVASIHGGSVAQNQDVDTGGGGRETYRVSFPRVLTLAACLVEVFPEMSHTPGRLQEHFMYLHWKDQVEIFRNFQNLCHGAQAVACT